MKVLAYLRILAFSVASYLFLDYLGSTEDTWVFEQYPWVWVFLGFVILASIAVEVSNAALGSVLYKTLNEQEKATFDQKRALTEERRFGWLKETYKTLLGSKSIEEEGEIILDHNYDGIRELDNKLPPWWVYSFYATIIFAVVYMARFHIFNGTDQIEEYKIALAEAKVQIEEYKRTAKDLVDVNTVELLTESNDLNSGKTIFIGNCVACHKESGGGGIGPNLTDDYWILGGGIKNVFKSIHEGGRAGKGMISWKTELKPSEIAQVASYVLSLHGSNPIDAKEPEGEVWFDETAAVDEVKIKTDSNKIEVIMEDEPVTGDVIDNN